MNAPDPTAATQRTTDEAFDQKLIEGLQRNERDALATAYDSYGGLAYALAARVMGVSSDAEDVVQESFLALWRQAPRLDAKRGLRSYLMTIVHNKAVDRLRQKGRRPEAVLNEDAPFKAPENEAPETVVEKASEADEVRAAMAGLSEDQRTAVEMTYFKGMTINDAAEKLGIPVGTVKSRLRLALGHMRRRLEGAT
ncbi:MAG: RNA polymerase sigma factor [Dehalococcoidia bacterium]